LSVVEERRQFWREREEGMRQEGEGEELRRKERK
jgi:hypothetical protein